MPWTDSQRRLFGMALAGKLRGKKYASVASLSKDKLKQMLKEGRK
jgi:hypothetical protein